MTNPLLEPSQLPFQLPDFALISDDDFLPAIEAGIEEQQNQIKDILAQDAEPDFVNTVEALEASGQILRRAIQCFYGVYSSDGTAERQKLVADISHRYAQHSNELLMNTGLYQRCAQAMENSAALLTTEQARTGKKWLDNFRSAGAHLDEQTRDELRELNLSLSQACTEFALRQQAGAEEAGVLFVDEAELVGVSDSDRQSLAAAAAAVGQKGYLISPILPLIQPITENMADRGAREKVFRASAGRGTQGENATTDLVLQIVRARARKAELLGYPDYASLVVEQQTAPNAAAVEDLLQQAVTPAMQKARAEASRLAEYAQNVDGLEDFQLWDRNYYEAKVRAADYSVDAEKVKEYFPLEQVLNDGVFYVAEKLFGITMHPREDLQAFVPEAKIWEVRDGDDSPIGLFIGDYFTRPTKQGGAWMTSFRDATDLLDELPVVLNVMNLTPAPEGEPTLLSLDEVTTVFHEFGHGLHGLLSTVEYPSVSGTSVPRDFVEFPSQFNEIWALWPEVIQHYARHYRTGEVLPEQLLQQIKRAEKFGQGYATVEYMAAALIDWAWHRLSSAEAEQITDVTAFEEAVLAKAGIDTSVVAPRYRSPFFKHVFASEHGYAAGYYSYFWSEVLDADAAAWISDQGGLNRANGQHYRNEVLAVGDARDPMESYRALTGREPEVEHVLARRGLLQS